MFAFGTEYKAGSSLCGHMNTREPDSNPNIEIRGWGQMSRWQDRQLLDIDTEMEAEHR